MRTSLILVLPLVLSALSAGTQAQSASGFSLDRFRPAPTTEDGLSLVLPRTLGHLRPGASLTLDYAHQPLVLSQPGDDPNGAIVKHRLVGHLTGALGVGERFEVIVYAPVTLVTSGDEPKVAGIGFPDPQSAAFGALSTGGTARLVGKDQDAFQLGALVAVTLPTGSEKALSGDDGVGAEGRLTGAYHLESWTVAANVGGRYVIVRPRATERRASGAKRCSLRAPITARQTV